MAARNKNNHRESWSACSGLGVSGRGRIWLLPLCALVCGWPSGRARCCRRAHAVGCADRTVLDGLVMRAAGDGHLLAAVLLIEYWNIKATQLSKRKGGGTAPVTSVDYSWRVCADNQLYKLLQRLVARYIKVLSVLSLEAKDCSVSSIAMGAAIKQESVCSRLNKYSA